MVCVVDASFQPAQFPFSFAPSRLLVRLHVLLSSSLLSFYLLLAAVVVTYVLLAFSIPPFSACIRVGLSLLSTHQ